MPGDHLLVEARPVPHPEHSCSVDDDPENGQGEHALRVGVPRVPQARYRLRQHHQPTREEHHGVDHGPDQGEALEPIGVGPRGLAPRQALHAPGEGEREAVTQVVQRVGRDGGAVCEPGTHDLDEGEDDV